MDRIKVLFIVNPIAGKGKQKNIESLIKKQLDPESFSWEIAYTLYAGHAFEIAKSQSVNFEIIAAVGGDGTMNEVGSGLLHSSCAMALIPVGSGNGLARHLGIPLELQKAIGLLNSHRIINMDTILMNERYFLNVAGVGFDALIAHKFATFGKRGLYPYVKLTIGEFVRFKPMNFIFKADGKEFEKKAFLISIANSSQFGNNAYISPEASVCDGLMDVCIMKKFPLLASPTLALKLFTKKMHQSKYLEILRTSEIIIIKHGEIVAHLDGEPFVFQDELKIKIIKESLKMVIPTGNKKV